jgi:ATP-dependent helicase/nuclease subunit B
MAFRQTYVGSGIEGVRRAIERAETAAAEGARRHPALRRIAADSYAAVRGLLDRVEAAMKPLERLRDGDATALASFAQAHLEVALAFAADENGDHGLLWLGDAGTVASRFLQQLIATGPDGFALGAADYRDFYRSLLASEQVRPTIALHPRLFIWGPMEARLMQPDVVILGSLNEGIWPEAADAGAWLNRSMLKTLGLPAPEERIGFSAHDFSQLIAAPRVVLTRSQKVDGNPTVPSRWLLRINALLGGLEAADALQPSPHEPWLEWAAQRHAVSNATPAPAPEPRPPVEVRPRRMSVTDVETWIANPYAIYAKHVLRLEELRPPEQEPGPDLRGTFIHQALSAFAKDYPDRLPDDPARELMARLDALLLDHLAHPRIAAFWRPRFERFADWFAETEAARREGVSRTFSEVTGERWLDGPAGRFELTARADRIDLRRDGLIITDYKTGTPPRQKQVDSNEKPQLPLEAAIAMAGGFSGIAETRVVRLNFIRANGGEPPGEEVAIKGDAAVIAQKSISGLEALIARFDQAETAYRPARRAGFDYRYDRYAHLARVAEWSVPGDDDDTSERE